MAGRRTLLAEHDGERKFLRNRRLPKAGVCASHTKVGGGDLDPPGAHITYSAWGGFVPRLRSAHYSSSDHTSPPAVGYFTGRDQQYLSRSYLIPWSLPVLSVL